MRYPDPRDRLTAASNSTASRLPQGWGNAQSTAPARAAGGMGAAAGRMNGSAGASLLTSKVFAGQIGKCPR